MELLLSDLQGLQKFDVVVIGAGAAGLMCAIEAGKRGRKVIIIDHANKPGKKILISGGGRCNFTNLNVSSENFLSQNPKFCKSALSRYTPQNFIALVKKHRISFHEKTLGQLFCDDKSSVIVNMLLHEAKKAGVEIKLNTSVAAINQKSDKRFLVNTADLHFSCESLVIATGGLSFPTMGASPFGYKVAEQFGLSMVATRAALVPFTLHVDDKNKFADLTGIAAECEVSCAKKTFKEALLFTHRGLSGPAMLQISSYWNVGDSLMVKLLSQKNLFEQLKKAQQQGVKLSVTNYLSQFLAKRLVLTFVDEDLASQRLQALSNKQLQTVANAFQQWQIKPNGTEGYRTAEVTLGGVDCCGVSSKTFEAKHTPGLYFIGEVLDVTGWLGGYNFQWAWASAYAAGQAV